MPAASPAYPAGHHSLADTLSRRKKKICYQNFIGFSLRLIPMFSSYCFLELLRNEKQLYLFKALAKIQRLNSFSKQTESWEGKKAVVIFSFRSTKFRSFQNFLFLNKSHTDEQIANTARALHLSKPFKLLSSKAFF